MHTTYFTPQIIAAFFLNTAPLTSANRAICLALLVLSFTSVPTGLSAQIENVWLGNTFGKAGDWHAPENWSRGHVPNDMEVAVIPDLSTKGKAFYPVIRFDAEVERIRICPTAHLTILDGSTLLINQIEETDVQGLNQIQNFGRIYLLPDTIAPRFRERMAITGHVKMGCACQY